MVRKPKSSASKLRGLPFVFPYGTGYERAKAAIDSLAPSVHSLQHLGLPQQPVPTMRRNLKNILIKSSLSAQSSRQFGCFRCNEENCPLCQWGWLTEGTRIVSMENGKSFNVRGHLTCQSPHVIYVVSCTRCGMQGVGETFDAVERVQSYVHAASALDHGTGNTAIHKHFALEDH